MRFATDAHLLLGRPQPSSVRDQQDWTLLADLRIIELLGEYAAHN